MVILNEIIPRWHGPGVRALALLENFSRFNGSFELRQKATSTWAKTTKNMDKVQLYFQ